jgi:hypothetical protein
MLVQDMVWGGRYIKYGTKYDGEEEGGSRDSEGLGRSWRFGHGTVMVIQPYKTRV